MFVRALGIAVLAAVLLIAVVAAFAPALAPAPAVREAFKAGAPAAPQVFAELINGRPDLAGSDAASVCLLHGGASSPAVCLDLVPTTVAVQPRAVTDGTVQLASAYDLVLAGSFACGAFTLRPAAATERQSLTFRHAGAGSTQALRSIAASTAATFPGWKLRLRSAAQAIGAHDLAQRASQAPVVPELCKAARLTGVTTAFRVADGVGSVAIVVLPSGRSPVFVSLAVGPGTTTVAHGTLGDMASASPAAIGTAASARSPQLTFTDGLQARRDAGGVRVRAEFVAGRVRVLIEQGMARRAYFCEAPGLLAAADALDTDALRPPRVLVRASNVDDLVVLPFPVGDLAALAT